MLPDVIEQVRSLITTYPSIPRFFGDWVFKETEKAIQLQPHHIFIDYLASPHGNTFAKNVSEMLELVLNRAPDQQARLRKKIVEKTRQCDFEPVLFELEAGSLLLKHGHRIWVEPLGSKGPDLKVVLSGYEVYIEAKKLQHDAEAALMLKRVFSLDERLKSESYPVSIHFTLYSNKDHQDDVLKQITEAVEIWKNTGMLKSRIECVDKGGKLITEANLYPPDTNGVTVGGGWSLNIDKTVLERRELNLYSEYFLERPQFPDDGLHVLIVDTSKRAPQNLMARAWSDYLQNVKEHSDAVRLDQAGSLLFGGNSRPLINALIECHREDQHNVHWMNDLTAGAIILPNPHSPLPEDIYATLTSIFQREAT
jgi:hypothetical protein